MNLSTSRLSDQLLLVARARISDKSTRNEANLRRASSDLYRQIDHRVAEQKCREAAQTNSYPAELRAFCKNFVTMKNKRVLSDYDPISQFSLSIVKNDLETCETRLREFWTAPPDKRTELARHIVLKRL